MPTLYKINMMASSPLMMDNEAPEGMWLLRKVEGFLAENGLVPVSASIERNDDEGELQYESKAWSGEVPEALLTSIAQRLDAHALSKGETGCPTKVSDLVQSFILERSS